MFFEMDLDSLLYALSAATACFFALALAWVSNQGDGEL